MPKSVKGSPKKEGSKDTSKVKDSPKKVVSNDTSKVKDSPKKEVSNDTSRVESVKDGKRRELKQRIRRLIQQSKGLDCQQGDILDVLTGTINSPNSKDTGSKDKGKGNRKLLIVLLVSIILPVLIATMPVFLKAELTPAGLMREFVNTPCVIENNAIVMEVARPLMDCNICSDLVTIPVERNLTQKYFIEKYAYSGVPVLVKGATESWTAMTEFSFNFFKDLYQAIPEALSELDEECQFFPYQTEFVSLKEVFEMEEDRAMLKPDKPNWYIGWSNCFPETASKLRNHYSKPFFLPVDSESSSIDWIFMGGSGEGANLHLDFVQRPSWQAQISGRKSWTLVPSPECESVCHNMNVTVEKGDIIVVDTNTWYHSTFVHPGDISITIGSEYD